MVAASELNTTSPQLSKAEAHVKELEDLEDYYFESDKQTKISVIAEKVLHQVGQALETFRHPTRDVQVKGLYLQGRALSFLVGRESESEEVLSKAIKLDPTYLLAWNALGEVHWNTQNYVRARESFEHALEFCGENPVSLRNLSMVLRAIDSGSKEDDEASNARRAENVALALEKAKAAVALDASDPQNWETLGNSYVGDFFLNARRPDELNRALIAYSKAEAAYEKLGKGNPSLQMNRGMAARYMEDYDLALRSFQKAHDIGMANAASEGQKVMELVQRLAGSTQRKGDLKAKRLKELVEDFDGRGEAQRTLRDVRTGEGTTSAPLAARVVVIIDRKDDLPVIILCCDSNGDFFALSVYNAQQSKVADAVVPMKTLLHVNHPKYRENSVTSSKGNNVLSYPCVRVAHPGDVTVVGGNTLAQAAVRSKFTAGAFLAGTNSEVENSRQPLDAVPPENSEFKVSPSTERWIDEEDAKIKKLEAKVKAAAKAKPKAKGKAKKKDRLSGKEVERKLHSQSQVVDLPLGWESAWSEDHKRHYYFNRETGASTWKIPQSDVCETESDAELETDAGGSASIDDFDEKDTVEYVEDDSSDKVPPKLRWSELTDSDDDECIPVKC